MHSTFHYVLSFGRIVLLVMFDSMSSILKLLQNCESFAYKCFESSDLFTNYSLTSIYLNP